MTNTSIFLAGLAILLTWFWLTLGQNIRRGRLAHGWSQDKLAELVGVESRTVQRWEADESRPRLNHLCRMQQLEIIDHFMPKVIYPYAAADPRNLIFLCAEENQRITTLRENVQ